jgi:hypothetical protein
LRSNDSLHTVIFLLGLKRVHFTIPDISNMKRGRIFGYSAITLVIIAGIILAVLGALGYLTPRKPGPRGRPVIRGGVNMGGDFATVDNVRPMWGLCMNGTPKTFDGVQYHLQTVCESPSCQVIVKATYTYPDGSTDVTSKTWGDSGLYHNPPTDVTKIPNSAYVEIYTDSKSGMVLQNTQTISIPSSC